MKRTISIILVLLICLTMFAGCAKDKGRNLGANYTEAKLKEYITLGQYKGIEYTYDLQEVTPEAVEQYLHDALSNKGYGQTKDITDRPVQKGDTVNIDYKGMKDGVAFEGGTAQGQDLVIGSKSFIDGFEDGLIGATIGETRNLNLTFPTEYHSEDLAGQAVVFEVKVNSIKAKVYPEITDDLIAEISDCKNLAEFQAYAYEQLSAQYKQEADSKISSDVWSKVLANVKINVLPQDEIEVYTQKVIEQYNNMYSQQYGDTFENALIAQGKSVKDPEIAQQLKLEAEAMVLEAMTIMAIAYQENLTFTDEQYNSELQKYAKEYGYADTKTFLTAIDEQQFHLMLLYDRVIDFVMKNAVEVK